MDNVALFLVRYGWLGSPELSTLASLDVEYALMLHDVHRLVEIDFSPLRDQRLGYKEKTLISRERVKMMAACTVYYGLYFRIVTRYLGGEYTGAGRDVDATLAEIGPHIDPDDFAHIRRVLTEGFPSIFFHQESRENKMTLLRRGN